VILQLCVLKTEIPDQQEEMPGATHPILAI
jgi:hypothetical protein